MKRSPAVFAVLMILFAPAAFADVLSPWEFLKLRPSTDKTKVEVANPASVDVVSAAKRFDDVATRALFEELQSAAPGSGTPERVRELAGQGADVNARTPEWEARYGKPLGLEGLEVYDLVDRWMSFSGEFRDGDIPPSRLCGGGETPLAVAVQSAAREYGYGVPVLEALVDLGCGVDSRDVRGMTPLMLAINVTGRHYSSSDRSSESLMNVVDFLLSRGADVNARDRWGRTPLTIAASRGCYPDLVGRLLEAGADANLRDGEGGSAVTVALDARDAPAEGVLFLLDAPVAPASLRNSRSTALALAAHADFRVQERLLAFEWTRAEKDDALLAIPSTGRLDLEKIRLLTEHGADINARDAAGRNVLTRFFDLPMEGREYGWDDVAGLIGMGLDVDARANDGGTALTLPGAGAFEALLNAGADVKASDDRGYTCLHAPREPDDVARLLEAGADPEAVALDGRTPLFFMNDPDAIGLLIARGADLNRRDREGATPLLTLLRRKTRHGEGKPEECIRRLLDAGADLNRADLGGTTPLMALVNDPSGEEGPDCSVWVGEFLERGADPNARRFDGRTALQIVLCQPTRYEQVGRDEVAEMDLFEWQKELAGMLLAAGADPDEPDLHGKSARDNAAEHRDPRVREAIAEIFAPSVPSVDAGRTPLMRAALEGDVKALERLLASGESVESRDRYGWTPLMFAAWGNPDARVARFLLDRGADPNARDALGKTPLMLAAWRNGNQDVFPMLIQCGADLSLQDSMGDNAIDMAVACDRSPDLLEVLWHSGVADEAERISRGSSMLLATASVTENPETIRTLLRPYIPVDCRDADGQTPLMKAVSMNRRPEIVRTLIVAGADPNAKDDRGVSVLDYALKGSREILNMLILAGIDLDGDSAYWKVWEKLLLVPDAKERLRDEAGDRCPCALKPPGTICSE